MGVHDPPPSVELSHERTFPVSPESVSVPAFAPGQTVVLGGVTEPPTLPATTVTVASVE
jgi:hypothetical protein